MRPSGIIVCALLALATVPQETPAQDEGKNIPVDCRIDDGACMLSVGDLSASFDVSPKPVTAMREVTFTVVLKDQGRAVTNAGISVDLAMPGMYMGTNRIPLSHQKDGIYEGKGIIIRCPSGKKSWQANVLIRRNNAKAALSPLSYVFEVH